MADIYVRFSNLITIYFIKVQKKIINKIILDEQFNECPDADYI